MAGLLRGKEKHEVRKSSYYVWFLGAKESKGLRGEEYILPVVRYLTGKEKEQVPIKVTLQLSNKGLKIIQNVAGKRAHENYRENVKHFIPHHAITCAVQGSSPNEDVVSTILLIYNPATACPVHVHSYRCDSPETAHLLQEQLQVLVDRPENQKKFLEIESRLQEKGLLQRNTSSAGSSKLGSDGRSLGRSSDSGAGSDKGSQLNPSEKIATMYDSLAAELREKLGGRQPLLLPPRDYDTMHRSRGNVVGSEERKSLNPRVVGASAVGRDVESSGKSSGIGSEEGEMINGGDASPLGDPGFLPDQDDRSSSDDEWPDGGHPRITGEDSLILVQLENQGDSLQQQPNLSSRFFQPRSRSGSSPPGKTGGKERAQSPETSKERFKGAKQLFLSLERRRSKERKKSSSPSRAAAGGGDVQPPQRNAVKQDPKGDLSEETGPGVRRLVEERQMEGQARWNRYEQEVGVSLRGPEWPKSDRDTGYVSRYSRDKSRSRDFEESPPAPARPNIFVKSGKKTNEEKKDKFQSKRLSRFLSRETLESDGYDHIEEFEEVEAAKARAKVKRQPSRTSLKLDYRRAGSRDSGRGDEEPPEPPPGPRRGFLRREVTELDMKAYRHGPNHPQEGFSKKYHSPVGHSGHPQPLWAMPRERALSPSRSRFIEAGERMERYPATKVLSPEFRKEAKLPAPPPPGENRYPSLDFRTDKRKSMYEGAGDVLGRYPPEPNMDYRRRSYHELSDVDKLDHQARNFQHSGRKIPAEPLGLPSRLPHRMPQEPPSRGYKQLGEVQRGFTGLDREPPRSKPLGPVPYKNTMYHPGPMPLPRDPRGPRSFDHPGSRPAMFRHSYAEPSGAGSSFARVSPAPHNHGRFGLASLKPY